MFFLFSSYEGSTACHLENGDGITGPAGGDTGYLLPAGAGNIATCPLGKMY